MLMISYFTFSHSVSRLSGVIFIVACDAPTLWIEFH